MAVADRLSWVRGKRFRKLFLFPPAAYAFLLVVAGDEAPVAAFIATNLAAFLIGLELTTSGLTWAEALIAALWPAVLLDLWQVYWALGMYSPRGTVTWLLGSVPGLAGFPWILAHLLLVALAASLPPAASFIDKRRLG